MGLKTPKLTFTLLPPTPLQQEKPPNRSPQLAYRYTRLPSIS